MAFDFSEVVLGAKNVGGDIATFARE